MINRIVLGLSAKDYLARYAVESLRDAVDAAQLDGINRLQVINTGLIEVGMAYDERKEKLRACHRKALLQLERAA